MVQPTWKPLGVAEVAVALDINSGVEVPPPLPELALLTKPAHPFRPTLPAARSIIASRPGHLFFVFVFGRIVVNIPDLPRRRLPTPKLLARITPHAMSGYLANRGDVTGLRAKKRTVKWAGMFTVLLGNI